MPRSLERQALAAAIERHLAAVAELGRVNAAQQRLDERFFDVLSPAVDKAEQARADAREAAPRQLVNATLGEPAGPVPSVADAEVALASAEMAVAEGRAARRLLEQEAERVDRALGDARLTLDDAVRAVLNVEQAAVVAGFFATGRRTLLLARILWTIGNRAQGVSADDLGLVLRVADIARPGAAQVSAFEPDPAWQAALDALHENPDFPLPGPPPDEPEDAGRAAAA